ncbi:MAG: glycerophosphoryl diester phosphodiesterase membrane domain-containing protein [Bacteroidales bacterium]|nr:glycerophosphoryl diester phosphodiesterase membrane domain-containing protein [Bacteroidales bacterium]
MDFYKQKDFGQLISAPFIFFGKEFKPLITGLLVFIGPFILTEYVLTNLFHFQSAESISAQLQNLGNGNFTGTLFIMLLISFFQNVMLYTYISAYIKTLSQEGFGNVEIQQVWSEMKRVYWPNTGGLFLGSIIIVIGLFLIILPGIYLAVALYPLFAIIIFENKGAVQSISRSLELIKGNWWLAFGLLIIMGIILISLVAVLTLFFQNLYAIIATGTSLFVLNSVTNSLLDVLSSVFFISTPIFLYGHLIALNEQPELVNRISEISDAEDITHSEKGETQNEDSGRDRLINDSDTDRFKPKF